MLRSDRTRLGTSAVLCAAMWSVSTLAASITWVPSGLSAGDTYHLVFVTSTTRNATSSEINDYNTFVDNVMGTIDDNDSPYGDIIWRAIGSTATVDAEDNIEYSASSSAVYTLDGTMVANSSADLWDGSIDSGISINTDFRRGL